MLVLTWTSSKQQIWEYFLDFILLVSNFWLYVHDVRWCYSSSESAVRKTVDEDREAESKSSTTACGGTASKALAAFYTMLSHISRFQAGGL